MISCGYFQHKNTIRVIMRSPAEGVSRQSDRTVPSRVESGRVFRCIILIANGTVYGIDLLVKRS